MLGHNRWHWPLAEVAGARALPRFIEQILKKFMYDENYQQLAPDLFERSALGFIVAGYSAGEPMAEDYQIYLDETGCHGPEAIFPKSETGLVWRGEPEAISRLVLGYAPGLADVLQTNLGVPETQIGPVLAVLQQTLGVNLMHPAMPIQDAIDLAEFLVDTAVRWARFRPGAATVGGPIEIAAIAKHEHFKWVRRKHYYSRELNPEVD